MEFVFTTHETDAEWDSFVATSPQGSIFSDSCYLCATGKPYSRFLVKTLLGEVLAGVAVMEDGRAMHTAPYPFTPYQGILFSGAFSAQSDHKRVTNEFRLTNFIIQGLIDHYGNFSMSLSPSFVDLRPFLWYNYHDITAPRFIISNRYTAMLDLSKFQLEHYLKSIRTVRRQEYNKSKAKIYETDDIALFIDLYLKTFKRQGIDVSEAHLSLIRRICCSSLTKGYGRLSLASIDDKVASMALFIYDLRCAYYLFGANDPDLRNSGASTALMVDNIRVMAEQGISWLDFVGVNSPNRGDFKLSFNPHLKAYHEVHLHKDIIKQ